VEESTAQQTMITVKTKYFSGFIIFPFKKVSFHRTILTIGCPLIMLFLLFLLLRSLSQNIYQAEEQEEASRHPPPLLPNCDGNY